MNQTEVIVSENVPHGLYLTHREYVNHDLLRFIDGDAAAPDHTSPATDTERTVA